MLELNLKTDRRFTLFDSVIESSNQTNINDLKIVLNKNRIIVEFYENGIENQIYITYRKNEYSSEYQVVHTVVNAVVEETTKLYDRSSNVSTMFESGSFKCRLVNCIMSQV